MSVLVPSPPNPRLSPSSLACSLTGAAMPGAPLIPPSRASRALWAPPLQQPQDSIKRLMRPIFLGHNVTKPMKSASRCAFIFHGGWAAESQPLFRVVRLIDFAREELGRDVGEVGWAGAGGGGGRRGRAGADTGFAHPDPRGHDSSIAEHTTETLGPTLNANPPAALLATDMHKLIVLAASDNSHAYKDLLFPPLDFQRGQVLV